MNIIKSFMEEFDLDSSRLILVAMSLAIMIALATAVLAHARAADRALIQRVGPNTEIVQVMYE